MSFRTLYLGIFLLLTNTIFTHGAFGQRNCRVAYPNATACIADCDCGWCSSNNFCLRGGRNGPNFDDHGNMGIQCEEAGAWNYSSTCASERLVSGVVGIVLGTATVLTLCSGLIYLYVNNKGLVSDESIPLKTMRLQTIDEGTA